MRGWKLAVVLFIALAVGMTAREFPTAYRVYQWAKVEMVKQQLRQFQQAPKPPEAPTPEVKKEEKKK